MNREIRLSLVITLSISVVLLVVCFALMMSRAGYYIQMLNELADIEDDNGMGGLAFLTAVGLIAVVAIWMASIPLIVTAIMQLPFIPLMSSIKSEKKAHTVVKVHLILSSIYTFFTSLAILLLTRFISTYIEASNDFNPTIHALMILLPIAGICLLASLTTTIVGYVKIHKQYVKLQEEERQKQQEIVIKLV